MEKFSVICFNNFNKTQLEKNKLQLEFDQKDLEGRFQTSNKIENFIELKTNTEIIEKYINKFFRKDKKINKQITTFNSKLSTCKIHNIKLI